jgi:hypothetical protein
LVKDLVRGNETGIGARFDRRKRRSAGARAESNGRDLLAEAVGETPGGAKDFSAGTAQRAGCVLCEDEDAGLS